MKRTTVVGASLLAFLLGGGILLAKSTLFAPSAGPAQATPAAASDEANRSLVTLEVDNLWCVSCAYIVEKTLARTPGVVRAKVSGRENKALVVYDPAKTSVDVLIAATTGIGYPSRVIIQ